MGKITSQLVEGGGGGRVGWYNLVGASRGGVGLEVGGTRGGNGSGQGQQIGGREVGGVRKGADRG